VPLIEVVIPIVQIIEVVTRQPTRSWSGKLILGARIKAFNLVK